MPSEYFVFENDNLETLRVMDDESINLIYIDPPFNTKKTQQIHGKSYTDSFDNFKDFIYPRLEEAYRILQSNGSLFFHIDYREAHYCKIWLDEIFGRDSFINEIVWAYDYGARSKKRWSTKHDTILWYAKDPNNYVFNYDEIDRIPYMAPALVGAEKAELGKTPTDVWWNTIVHTRGKERWNYPTQKPLTILERIVRVHSNKGDLLLDFFAGSGSFGEAALLHDRNVILVDSNPQAIAIIEERLAKYAQR